MKLFKHIFIFFLLWFISIGTSFAGSIEESQCINETKINIKSESVLKTLSEDDRLKFVYCLVDENGGPNAENEDELIEDAELEDINLASSEELKILLNKKGVLAKENKELGYWERKKVVEINSGQNCGGKVRSGESNNIITCIKDPRKQAFKMWELDSGRLGYPKRWMNSMWTGIINGSLFAFSEFVSNSAFGYTRFDELPDLPYENIGDMFDITTLYGLVNSFALAVLGFVVLYYFLKIGTSRGGDDYKLFLMKIAFVLLFVVFFSFLYKGLQGTITLFETSLIDSISKLTTVDQTNVIEGIRMDIFDLGALTSITLWTIIFFIPNVLLLLVISILIYVRDLFLLILLNLFFLSAVGFLGGTLKKENIFEGTSVTAKMSKFSVYAMFWIISLFITVVITIFIFKFVTIMGATFPSIETDNVSLVGNLTNFSIDSFVYLVLLIVIIFFGKKTLLKSVFNGVSNFFMGIFFPGTQSVGGYSDMITDVKDGYADVKMGRENLAKNNPMFKAVTNSVSSRLDKTADLVKRNEFVQNASSVLNEKQQSLRDSLRPVKNRAKLVSNIATGGYIQDRSDLGKIAKAGLSATLGIGGSHLTHAGNIEEKRSDLNRELSRRESALSKLDEGNTKDVKEITKLKGRIETINKEKEQLKEFEIMHTSDAREKTEYVQDKSIKEMDKKVGDIDKEISEKKATISRNKEDIDKLDIEKNSELISDIETRTKSVEEDVKTLERTKVVAKNLKEIRKKTKEMELENIDKRSISDVIKIPNILKKQEKVEKGAETVIETEEKTEKQEGIPEEIKVQAQKKTIKIPSKVIEKKTQIEKKELIGSIEKINRVGNTKQEKVEIDYSVNVIDKVGQGLHKYELKEEISDFTTKYENYKETFDEEIFGGNPIFKYLYDKEVKRAGGEDFIDLDVLNTDIQDTLEMLKEREL